MALSSSAARSEPAATGAQNIRLRQAEGARTDVRPGFAVGHGVQQANQAACIANGLLVPDHFLAGAAAGVLGPFFVLGGAESLVGVAGGEGEQQSECRTRHKGEQLVVVNAENVVERELGR